MSEAYPADHCGLHCVAYPLKSSVLAFANMGDVCSSICGDSGEKKPGGSVDLPRGPVVYLTSTAFVTETQWVRFIQVVLARRGILQAGCMGSSATREVLLKTYASEIQKLKVTFINDAGYH